MKTPLSTSVKKPNPETPDSSARKTSFWWSFWFILLFLYTCGTYAIERSFSLWGGPPHTQVIIGWTILGICLAIMAWLWVARRRRMRWSGRIVVVGAMAVILAAAGAFFTSTTLGIWHTREAWSALVSGHPALMKMTHEWKAGKKWNEGECLLAKNQAMSLRNEAMSPTQNPLVGLRGLIASFNVARIRYQAGCAVDWSKWKKPPETTKAWEKAWPQYGAKRVNEEWKSLWPGAFSGCIMHLNRAEALGKDGVKKVIFQICSAERHAGGNSQPWDPSQFAKLDDLSLPQKDNSSPKSNGKLEHKNKATTAKQEKTTHEHR